jgi:predicted deacylase
VFVCGYSYFPIGQQIQRDADHMRHTPGINHLHLIKNIPSTFLFFLACFFVTPAMAQTEFAGSSQAVVISDFNARSLSSSSLPAMVDGEQSANASAMHIAAAAVSSVSGAVEVSVASVSSAVQNPVVSAATEPATPSSSVSSFAPSSLASDIVPINAASISSAGSGLPGVKPSPMGDELSTGVVDEGVALARSLSQSKFILDAEVKPGTSVRLTWNSETAVGGFSEATPVLVINGATPGKTLCLTGAVHGDELNGIEMIRRVIFEIDPAKLTGTIIGVPVANIMGFRRNSRYLPDRRDWNRYFPGNTRGSSASRLAHSFFTKIIMHCDALVDLHTGSFHRTNLPQLRADLSDERVARLAQSFGVIAVLNGRGNPNSLRAAAVSAGIPAVTLEAGEPMAMQSEVVEEGVKAINTLLAKTGMYGKQQRWTRIAPVYYRSAWVRANQSGILFSKAALGQRVKVDDVLGTVTDPITNARTTIKSPYNGRIIGMALDQVVLPGFAAYHIGIQTPEAILIEESQLNEDGLEEDEEDGDDSGVESSDEIDEPETGVSKAQDRMADE